MMETFPAMDGFGHYSMNLLSPVMPQVSAIPGFGGILDQTGGQYGDFCFLGLARSFSAVNSVAVWRRRECAHYCSDNRSHSAHYVPDDGNRTSNLGPPGEAPFTGCMQAMQMSNEKPKHIRRLNAGWLRSGL
jgi:hypothetical protein